MTYKDKGEFLITWWSVIDGMNKMLPSTHTVSVNDVLIMSDEQKKRFLWVIMSAKTKGITFFEAADKMQISHFDIFPSGKVSSKKMVEDLRDSYLRKLIKQQNLKEDGNTINEKRLLIKLKRLLNERQREINS